MKLTNLQLKKIIKEEIVRLQEDDEYVALEEQIISYLKEHGPSKVAEIRRAGLPDPTHGRG